MMLIPLSDSQWEILDNLENVNIFLSASQRGILENLQMSNIFLSGSQREILEVRGFSESGGDP